VAKGSSEAELIEGLFLETVLAYSLVSSPVTCFFAASSEAGAPIGEF
jgi:hypothetical protein